MSRAAALSRPGLAGSGTVAAPVAVADCPLGLGLRTDGALNQVNCVLAIDTTDAG